MRLLVVEDDDRTGSYLARGLTESGHIVDRAADGELGLALASEGIYDVLIVDRRLPVMDGLTLIRRLRERDKVTPILVLSAIGGTADRIEGMRAGCDDYLAKPYAFAEVLARLEALVRRADRALGSAVLRVGDLEVDIPGRRASRTGKDIHLQHRELLLLAFLMRHAGQVVTRSMLLETAWNYDFEPRGNIIDMHVHRLRQKVDEGFAYPLIHTVLGAGYMIREPVGAPPAPDPVTADDPERA
ncbi:response regulator transcription factor [Acidisphaera sp. S103]|uniref:response regulator transcription factor n=1 Tax=Acidisphaera sp. S103 TaxID=1747223 RepID=UPI00131DA3D4|nr:response regulator transcription factor [Acidisphaera sp. S103]